MAQINYQEPLEKENIEKSSERKAVGKESIVADKTSAETRENIPSPEKEIIPEKSAEQDSEKIETARKAIQTQQATTHAAIHDDAKVVAEIQEYEKKVEKLVEIALLKGPEHAIRVAEHMDANDNYTLDELHDKMLADDLRKQLIQKGLLKEL